MDGRMNLSDRYEGEGGGINLHPRAEEWEITGE